MIDTIEIQDKAKDLGLNPTDIEKDYVHGRILRAVFEGSSLGRELVLKGGNCLRKGYLPNTRFSKDLDFSSIENIDETFLREELNRICSHVQAETGIDFDTERTLVKDKGLPIPGVEALEARLYFKGFYNEENIVLKTQMDVTQFDKIYLPIQQQALIHPYSDYSECKATLRCQKIEEVLASKLTTLLHRRKAVDLFDLLYSVLIAKDFRVVRREVISTFLKKSVFEAEPNSAKLQFLELPLDEFKHIWGGIVGPIRSLFSFDYVVGNFHAFIEGLFALILPELSSVSSPKFGPQDGIPNRGRIGLHSLPYFSSTIRNTIINSGRSLNLVSIFYDGINRLVEPYKLEYRIRKSDSRGLEYFWAYDPFGSGKSKTPGIRQYICDKIETASRTDLPFMPRYEIEL
jgi:predicted nucleotidyltransferase component of viral defense system